MRKFLALVCSIILCFCFVGCDLNVDNPQNSQQGSGGNIEIVGASKDNKLNAYAIESINEENKLVAEYVENMKNKYHVYYFYLGLINQVPVYSSVALQYVYDDTEVSITFNSLTEESFSNTVSKAEEIIDTHSYTGGFELGFEQEVGVDFDVIKVKFTTTQTTDHHWTDNWGKTINESKSVTSSYLNSYSQSYAEKVVFSEEAGFTKGHYYRMSFYETVKAYGVLVYDVDSGKYTASSQTFLKSNSTVRVWEESQNGVFDYEKAGSLKFDIDDAIAYAKENPLAQVEMEDENTGLPESQEIINTMNRYNCNDGNGYNKNEEEESTGWKAGFDDVYLGKLLLYGCREMEDGYQLVDKDAFAIRYEIEQDLNDLPRDCGKDTPYWTTSVCGDRDSVNMNDNGPQVVGYGAYWIRIIYKNNKQDRSIGATNIFQYKNKGTVLEFLTIDNIDPDLIDEIVSIEVVVVYELKSSNNSYDEYTNWRCEYTYNFVKSAIK